jgi:hypothetical protein
MRKSGLLLSLIISLSLTNCEKGYDDEIFIEKYRPIYGKWQYQISIGETGFIKLDSYTIEFIPYGLFRYNDGKKGKVKIVEQDENTLSLDFGSLFPDIEYATIGIYNSGDTLAIVPNNNVPRSFYTRIK